MMKNENDDHYDAWRWREKKNNDDDDEEEEVNADTKMKNGEKKQ